MEKKLHHNMRDDEILEKYGLRPSNFGSWALYLSFKVKIIRKNGLESVKMMYDGYHIYDIYSYNGDAKFDVVVLSRDGWPQLIVNHYKKEVTPIHGYMGCGKNFAKEIGYKYCDLC